MDTLQELEFIIGPEDAVIADQAQAPASLAGVWGAWSLVPASCPSEARRRRLAAAARVRMSLQPDEAVPPIL